MKYDQNSDSDTERLIEQAFERDLARLRAPSNAPPTRLLKKISEPATPTAKPPAGIFGSSAAMWLVIVALGSLAAGIVYFTSNSKPTDPVKTVQQSRNSMAQVDTVKRDSIRQLRGATRSVKKPTLLPDAKPSSRENSGSPSTSERISEDSLLRLKVAHPAIIEGPDSARTTIHPHGHS